MSKNNVHDLEVGQKLYVVDGLNFHQVNKRWMEVIKIGRKWVTVKSDWIEYRVHIETLRIDGGVYSSPGRAYLSEQHYEDGVLRRQLWDGIKSRIPHNCPAHLRLDELRLIDSLVFKND